MALGRRGFLQSLAAAPLGAHAAMQQAKVALLSGGAAGLLSGAGGDVPMPSGVASGGPLRFTNFASWFEKFGGRLREQAKHVGGLDPDLIEMRLPLVTKVRMQRERNFEALKNDQRRRFDEILSVKGFFEWWA